MTSSSGHSLAGPPFTMEQKQAAKSNSDAAVVRAINPVLAERPASPDHPTFPAWYARSFQVLLPPLLPVLVPVLPSHHSQTEG